MAIVGATDELEPYGEETSKCMIEHIVKEETLGMEANELRSHDLAYIQTEVV